MPKPIIAIDGPAASGKGTLARRLAGHLGFAYLDTGKLYRAVAFELLQAGLSAKDKNDARDAAQILVKKLARDKDSLDNPALKSDEIGQAASMIAVYPEVRAVLIDLQKNFAKTAAQGAILDGRDIGTVICPDADLKLFITASDEIRAERRLKELHSSGKPVTYSTVLEDLRARDARDSGRDAAPMEPAQDAITLDSSDLDADAMFENALKIIKERLQI